MSTGIVVLRESTGSLYFAFVLAAWSRRSTVISDSMECLTFYIHLFSLNDHKNLWNGFSIRWCGILSIDYFCACLVCFTSSHFKKKDKQNHPFLSFLSWPPSPHNTIAIMMMITIIIAVMMIDFYSRIAKSNFPSSLSIKDKQNNTPSLFFYKDMIGQYFIFKTIIITIFINI